MMSDIDNAEVIALVLPSGAMNGETEQQDFVATGTMLVIRHPDGLPSLQSTRPVAMESRTRIDGQAFYKSRPVFHSGSIEISGHELEMIASTLLC